MADSVTAVADPFQAGVLVNVHIDSTAGAGPVMTVTLERSTNGGTSWTQVANAVSVPLIGATVDQGDAYIWDHAAPLNTAVTYRATASPIEVVLTSSPVTITTATEAWLKDPARPWANLPLNTGQVVHGCATESLVSLSRLEEEAYAADRTLFPVLNRRRPGSVFALRKDVSTSVRLISHTLASMFSVQTLFAWGGPVFLQVPTAYGLCDRYYQPATFTSSRVSQDMSVADRVWGVPLDAVDSPVGPAQGTVENNWCAVVENYPTWDALEASGLTWAGVVAGSAAPVDGYGGGAYGDGPYGDGG